MLHRTTLVVAPILSLVVVGAGLGWWGYDQSQQRASLAVQFENQYSSSFHGLVSSMQNLDDELGKCLISGDEHAFQLHLADVWRLSYAAQTDIGRLPFDLMPLHSQQAFLSSVAQTTHNWMDSAISPKDSSVHRQLEAYYTESKHLTSDLTTLQSNILAHGLTWKTAVQATHQGGHVDNQIVDGFKAIDDHTTAFIESADSPSTMQKGRTDGVKQSSTVTKSQAQANLAKFINVNSVKGWTVTVAGRGAVVPEYIINGTEPDGEVNGIVSKQDGKVISFNIDHHASSSQFDYVEAQQRAEGWLHTHGYANTRLFSSSQYQHVAYFVFVPTLQGQPVVSQGIRVTVALDEGTILSFDATQYIYHPVHSLPVRKYSVQSLRRKISSHFQIRMSESVIALGEKESYQPAVMFTGTAGKQTFRIYMNANTGDEMSIEQMN